MENGSPDGARLSQGFNAYSGHSCIATLADIDGVLLSLDTGEPAGLDSSCVQVSRCFGSEVYPAGVVAKGQSTPNDINLLRLLSRGILLLQGRSYETFELQHIVSFSRWATE